MIDFTLGWLAARTGTRVELLGELRRALDAPRGRRGRLVGFVNPHVYLVGERDVRVRRFLAACDLVCVDGVGCALAHRLAGRGALPRTVAEHLFRAVLTELDRDARTLLVGIEPEALPRAVARMNAASGGPRVVAALDGYADDAALAAFLDAHAIAGAPRTVDAGDRKDEPSADEPRAAGADDPPAVDLVVVGAGSPRSEAIALRARERLPDAIVFHAGAGTVKTWAGTKRRGPSWMSACGLEWLHRVAFEPHTRSRYLGGGPRFALALLRHRARRPDPTPPATQGPRR